MEQEKQKRQYTWSCDLHMFGEKKQMMLKNAMVMMTVMIAVPVDIYDFIASRCAFDDGHDDD